MPIIPLAKRHIVILESKSGKIDIEPKKLFGKLFKPLRQLFPGAQFTYVLFAEADYLFDKKYRSYRMLGKIPKQIFKELAKHKIPTLFFNFTETESNFRGMCDHLILTSKALSKDAVNVKGYVEIDKEEIVIFSETSKSPYLKLLKDPVLGTYRVVD